MHEVPNKGFIAFRFFPGHPVLV